MAKCTRCGSEASEESFAYFEEDGYPYCEDCWSLFEEIAENGVRATWRSNNAGRVKDVYVISVAGEGQGYEKTQVQAFARCLDLMEKHDSRGLFEYSPSGSRWLVEEYLDAHPSIADDVKSERTGFLAGLFG